MRKQLLHPLLSQLARYSHFFVVTSPQCRAYKLVLSSLDIHWLLKALSPEGMPPQIETQDLVATMEGSPSADFLRSWWESKRDYTGFRHDASAMQHKKMRASCRSAGLDTCSSISFCYGMLRGGWSRILKQWRYCARDVYAWFLPLVVSQLRREPHGFTEFEERLATKDM